MDRPKIVRKIETLEQLLYIVQRGVCKDSHSEQLYTNCSGINCEECIVHRDGGAGKGVQWIKDVLL